MQILGFRDDFAARQDKLHQEFYNVPTKEVDLAGWDQFSGFWGSPDGPDG